MAGDGYVLELRNSGSGNGSPGHSCAGLLKQLAGNDMVHIPYQGAGPALIGAIGGHASLDK